MAKTTNKYEFRPLTTREIAALAVYLEAMHVAFGEEEKTCRELVPFGDDVCPQVMHLLTDGEKFSNLQDRSQALGRCFQRTAEKVIGGFVVARRRNDRGNYVYKVQKLAQTEPTVAPLSREMMRSIAAGDELALAEVAQKLDELIAHWLPLRAMVCEALGAARARRQL